MTYALPNELVNCAGCGAAVRHIDYVPAARHEWQGKQVHFITGCDSCGSIFVNPPPPDDEVNVYYGEGGGWLDKQSPEWGRELSISISQTRQFSDTDAGKSIVAATIVHARRLFGDDLTGRHILDFGCGRGQFMDKVSSYGFDCTGLDPATRPIVTRHRMIDELPEEPTFDVVVALHVIEHIANPLATLRALRRALRDPGLLLLGTPNINRLWEHRQKAYVLNERVHLSGYTQQSMTALLAKAGFRTVEFPPGTKPHRLRCVALVDDNVPLVDDPLAEAVEAFRRFREGDPHWNPTLSVRENAERYNRARRRVPGWLRSLGRRARMVVSASSKT